MSQCHKTIMLDSFFADPDPAVFLNADPDPDVDPALPNLKFCNKLPFNFRIFLFRIRIPNSDPDPEGKMNADPNSIPHP